MYKVYDEVIFTTVDKGIYPNKQFAASFFISECFFDRLDVALMPLTLGRFIRACIRNSMVEMHWRILRTLYKAGFIDIPEGAAFHWKYFRLNFWSPKKENHV